MSLPELLAELHEATATKLLEKLKTEGLSAPEMAIVMALLKHNNIQAPAGVSKAQDDLARRIFPTYAPDKPELSA